MTLPTAECFRKLDDAVSNTYTVKAAQTVRGGFPVKLDTNDNTIIEAGADDFDAIGVAHKPGVTHAAASRVEVFVSNAIVPVIVGTGGATRGKRARIVATGFTDAPAAAAGGGTMIPLYGQFMQSGVAGDWVGMKLEYCDREIA